LLEELASARNAACMNIELMSVRRSRAMVRSCLPVMLLVLVPASLGAQPAERQPVVELALRERLQQAVAQARAALAAVDIKTLTVEPASGARISASGGRARESLHLILTAAEFARQNPSSASAQLILLLQLDGFQAQVDSVAVNIESAIGRSPAAAADRLGEWADGLSQSLDALFKVRLALETVVTEMVTDVEKRLRDCGK
jgi:hypothetical protein